MSIRRIFAAIAAVLAIVAGSVAFAGSALADPGTQQPYNAVGSNTTQDVVAALAGQLVNAFQWPVILKNVGSWEATGTSPILPISPVPNPADTGAFTRPNGSGAGIAALSAAVNVTPPGDYTGGTPNQTFDSSTIAGEVQFARSSSGPSPVDPNGPLTYIPFARDAVGYIWVGAPGSNAELNTLTQADLTQIYQGGQPFSDVTIDPYLPQSGSGTRNFFQGVIGVPNASLGSDVNASDSNEENTASVLGDLSLPAGTAAIYPFSISSLIAQTNVNPASGVTYSTNTGTASVHVGSIGGVSPTTPDGSNLAPNPAFYDGTSPWGRDVYNVFPTLNVSNFVSGIPDLPGNDFSGLLNQFIVTAANPNPAITSAAAQAVIEGFGFEIESYDNQVGSGSKALGGDYTDTP